MAQDAGEPTFVSFGSEGFHTLKLCWPDSPAERELYAVFVSAQEDKMYLTMNLNHPIVTQRIERDPEELASWADKLYVGALVGRAERKPGGSLPPRGFRVFEDAFPHLIMP